MLRWLRDPRAIVRNGEENGDELIDTQVAIASYYLHPGHHIQIRTRLRLVQRNLVRKGRAVVRSSQQNPKPASQPAMHSLQGPLRN